MSQTARTGVRFVLSNSTDPDRLTDFRAWYDSYAHALTAIGELRSADRFENATASGTDDDPRFLALYDIGSTDPAAAWPRTEQSSAYPTPLFDDPRAKLMSPAFRGSFAAVGSQIADRDHGSRSGVLIVLSNGGDDTARHKWEQDALRLGQFYSAARLRLIEGFPAAAEWLEIYEADAAGVPEPLGSAPGSELQYESYFNTAQE